MACGISIPQSVNGTMYPTEEVWNLTNGPPGNSHITSSISLKHSLICRAGPDIG